MSFPLLYYGSCLRSFFSHIINVTSIDAALNAVKTTICLLYPSPYICLTISCTTEGKSANVCAFSRRRVNCSGLRIDCKPEEAMLLSMLEHIAIPIEPPRARNCGTAPIATAVMVRMVHGRFE